MPHIKYVEVACLAPPRTTPWLAPCAAVWAVGICCGDVVEIHGPNGGTLAGMIAGVVHRPHVDRASG